MQHNPYFEHVKPLSQEYSKGPRLGLPNLQGEGLHSVGSSGTRTYFKVGFKERNRTPMGDEQMDALRSKNRTSRGFSDSGGGGGGGEEIKASKKGGPEE